MPSESSGRPEIDRRPFHVAGWRVDPSACRLARDGDEVHIEPKVMLVLVHLAERPGQVVGRRELEELVWTDTVVGYEAVTNAVIKLRKALGDDARHPEIIETIPKRGYRLLAEVTPLSPENSTKPWDSPPNEHTENAGADAHSADGDSAPSTVQASPALRRRSAPVIALVALVVVLAGALGWWRPWAPEIEPASLERMAHPLPDEPSLAVLPFDNLSGDPEQEILVDGFTENLINGLARLPGLFVIARNSTFTYKGKPVKVQQVAEDLGIRYVLEGSVRRSEDQIRITAQLIDALSGHHLWADTYDRNVTDIFTIQDEITLHILRELQIALTAGELARRQRSDPDNLEFYILAWNAAALYLQFNSTDNNQARQLALQALALEPGSARAASLVGWTHQVDARFGWSDSPEQSYRRGAEWAQKALAIDPTSPSVHRLLSNVYVVQRDFDKAIEAGERSIELSPSIATSYANTALATYYAGDFERTVTLTKEAMRLHPFYPAWYAYRIGVAYRMLGRYEEAVAALREFYDRIPKPNMIVLTALASTYSMMGDMENAREIVDETLELYPDTSVEQAAKMHYFKHPEDLERILEALRQAGLPERSPSR